MYFISIDSCVHCVLWLYPALRYLFCSTNRFSFGHWASFRWAFVCRWHTLSFVLWTLPSFLAPQGRCSRLILDFSALALPTSFAKALVPFSGEWYLETRCIDVLSPGVLLLLGSLLTDRRCMCVFIDQPTCTCLPLMISVTVLSSVDLSMASPTPQEHASHHRSMLASSLCAFVSPFSDRETPRSSPAHLPQPYTCENDCSIHQHPCDRQLIVQFSTFVSLHLA